MKFNITRQQPFTSLLLLLVISIVGAVVVGSRQAPQQSLAMESLLSGYINNFQTLYPVISIFAAAIMVIYGVMILGRYVTQLKLYDFSSSIQIPILALLSWGIAISEEYLLCAIILTANNIMTAKFLNAIRSRYTFGDLFNASTLLSLLPLLYAPSFLLLAMIPIMLIIMGVTLREWIVAMSGIIFTPALAYYIIWLCTGQIAESVEQSIEMITAFSGILTSNMLPLGMIIISAVVVMLTLAAIATSLTTDKTHNSRMRMTALIVIFIASAATIAMPSSNLITLTLITPSAGLLITYLMTRSNNVMANIIYAIIWCVAITSIIVR